ncbi:MAG: hypothetical protein M2R45_04252 [Verrucomicrobia subdivision 3 bacterium]|nr:hypothetical protein [Limisphaerales bacterium]MCS1412622.1 hypothetical protein [Limisphaerales bacterium]
MVYFNPIRTAAVFIPGASIVASHDLINSNFRERNFGVQVTMPRFAGERIAHKIGDLVVDRLGHRDVTSGRWDGFKERAGRR